MSLQFRPATVADLSAVVSLLQVRELPVDGFADLLRAHPHHVLLACREERDRTIPCWSV